MASNVWIDILARIETKVNRHSFYTWFKPTRVVDETGQQLSVRVPNGLFRDWLTKHYAGVVTEAVAELGREGLKITFVTEKEADVSMATENCTLWATENCTLRGESCRAAGTFSR